VLAKNKYSIAKGMELLLRNEKRNPEVVDNLPMDTD
jgi:hypothetical protein